MEPMIVKQAGQPQLIMGIIPCSNRYYLDLIWPVINPGIKELVSMSEGELNEYRTWREIFAGAMHLYMLYLDRTGTATNEKFQELFVSKLNTPEQDYVGFAILQLIDSCASVYMAYLKEEYRGANIYALALQYIETQVKAMGAPYLALYTRPNVKNALRELGFIETYTTYRKRLK